MDLCFRSAATAILIALAPPALGDEAPKIPQIIVETQGNVTTVTTGGTGWAGVIEAVQKLRSLPPDKDAEVVDVLQKDMDSLPPAYIYELARRTCGSDPDRAVYLFNLAGTRARYDAYRCVDETALEGVPATLMSLPMPDCEAITNTSKMVAALRRLRTSKESFSSTASPWWICSHGMAAVIAGLANKPLATSEWEKPAAEWDAVKRDIDDQIDSTIKTHATD